jgi:hypothetical protein
MSKTSPGLDKTYHSLARKETDLPESRFFLARRKIRGGLPGPIRYLESNIRWFEDWPACMRVL